jgi:hypothetical protein
VLLEALLTAPDGKSRDLGCGAFFFGSTAATAGQLISSRATALFCSAVTCAAVNRSTMHGRAVKHEYCRTSPKADKNG